LVTFKLISPIDFASAPKQRIPDGSETTKYILPPDGGNPLFLPFY
jgi:hypothetical protein